MNPNNKSDLLILNNKNKQPSRKKQHQAFNNKNKITITNQEIHKNNLNNINEKLFNPKKYSI
jgi:hypothetical protein